jgi:hypothetical protein
VGVAVTAQRIAHGVAFGRRPFAEQPGQVAGLLAGCGLGDDLGGGRADPRQRLQRPRLQPPLDLTRCQVADHLGGAPEGPHPVGRRAAPLQLERDLPQRLPRVHWWTLPRSFVRHPRRFGHN